MDAELRPGADFYAAVAKLKGASPEIRKKLNAEVRSATKPIERTAKQAVLDLESKGVKGGGRSQRRDGAQTRMGPLTESQETKLNERTGLRQTVARAIQTKITYSGRRTGVRVRVDTTKMPENQRKLPKGMNEGKVRHPVFGNKNIWTNQTFSPEGWFTKATREQGTEAVRKIKQAAQRALNDLG